MDYTRELNLKYTNELKALVKNCKKPSLMINAKGRKRDKTKPKYAHLKDFVIWKTPLLQDEIYKLKTRIYWIIHDIKDWNNPLVRCKNPKCNKPLYRKNVTTVHVGYHEYCSRKCASGSIETKQKVEKTCYKRYGAKRYFLSKDGKEKIENVKLKKYGSKTYNNVEKAKQTRYQKNNGKYESIISKEKRKQTNKNKYGYECNLQSEDSKEKSLNTLKKHFGKHIQHISQTQYFKEKFKDTSLKNFGTEHLMQNENVQSKMKRKYKYDKISFDSAPEIAFYIFMKDHNFNIQYHPDMFFYYEFNGKRYKYFPDFIVDDQIFELKGIHFFEDKDPNGRMICPFKNKNMSSQKYQLLCEKYEAKHKCTLANGVKILTNDDYQKYLDYVKNKYGKNYLMQFRTDNIIAS